MIIFISSKLDDNKIQIHENCKFNKNMLKEDFQIIFTDGNLCIDIIKELYITGRNCYVLVTNLVFFLSKIAVFRNLNIQLKVDLHCKINEDYCAKQIKKYKNIEKKHKVKTDKDGKSIDLSFRPKIYDSVRTSLGNNKIYLCKEMICHRIYARVKDGKCKMSDLEDICKGVDLHKTLKSMIFAGIIIKKDDSISLNEILL